ncbi:ferredoxin reductase family protein [Gordonia rhizosphera NBRC 16068]|uniref:ferredoxin reductase family protein n=1 Tax=Gordonia rhizosphera TaxID=83341 RepID=UPI003EDE915F
MTSNVLPPRAAPPVGATPTPDGWAAYRRPRPTPRWWRDATAAAMWGILLFVTALWVAGGGLTDTGTLGTTLTSIGRLAGLWASALLLVQVIMMARVPVIERAWGQDALTRLHRWVGFGSFTLLLVHIVFVTIGYADADVGRIWHTVVDLTLDYPGMLLAIAGTAAIVMVVVTSYRASRRRLRYESWHLIHLYGYLGAGLVLPHQLWTGQEFLQSTSATVFWWSLWILCAASVLAYRIALPLWRSWRNQLRVAEVRRDGPHTVTVTVAGPRVRSLRAQGGQFFWWRFLTTSGGTRAHPFSLSAAPTPHTLRFTADIVGDGTRDLTTLTPGTRVLVEGPYGRLHGGVRRHSKVLLLGSGIGMAPMRALLEDLDAGPGDITVVYRTHSVRDAVLDRELSGLAQRRRARYVMVDGRRNPDRSSWLPANAAQWDDAAALLHLCPDIADHDIYICGPPEWMTAVRAAAKRAGAQPDSIHCEYFEI